MAAKRAPYLKRAEKVANPTLQVNCSSCGGEFKTWTRRSQYCSARCKTAGWRAAKRESAGPSLCWWCSAPIAGLKGQRYCSARHKNRFAKAKKAGKPITVKVSETLTVQTREYEDIVAVRGRWLAHLSDYSY
jgi:hypothetical protein